MNFIKLLFPRKKTQGLVSISPMASAKPEQLDQRKIDQALNDLHADVMAKLKNDPLKTTEQKVMEEKLRIRKELERQKRIRTSTVEQRQAEIKVEHSLFRGWDMPGWKVAEHNFKQGHEMTQRDYLNLFHAVIDNGLRTVNDLPNLNDKVRDLILNRVWDKPTFMKLIRIAWEINRDAPPNRGITRTQFIHNRLSKVFNP